MSTEFDAVARRLGMVLGARGEVEIARALGIKQPAFSGRKSRGAVPRDAIDTVLARYGISPGYVYEGTGPMLAPGTPPNPHVRMGVHFADRVLAEIAADRASLGIAEPELRERAWCALRQAYECVVDAIARDAYLANASPDQLAAEMRAQVLGGAA